MACPESAHQPIIHNLFFPHQTPVLSINRSSYGQACSAGHHPRLHEEQRAVYLLWGVHGKGTPPICTPSTSGAAGLCSTSHSHPGHSAPSWGWLAAVHSTKEICTENQFRHNSWHESYRLVQSLLVNASLRCISKFTVGEPKIGLKGKKMLQGKILGLENRSPPNHKIWRVIVWESNYPGSIFSFVTDLQRWGLASNSVLFAVAPPKLLQC